MERGYKGARNVGYGGGGDVYGDSNIGVSGGNDDEVVANNSDTKIVEKRIRRVGWFETERNREREREIGIGVETEIEVEVEYEVEIESSKAKA